MQKYSKSANLPSQLIDPDRVMVLDELQTGRDPLESCRHVLARFRELLRLRHQASVDTAKAAGLFAELLWMRRIAGHSPHAALSCWRGDSGGIHDFATTDHAVEVKATLARETLNIPISSIDQLEPPRGGTLHLYVVRLDTEPDPDALSVPELIDRLTSEGVDRTALLDRLAESTGAFHLRVVQLSGNATLGIVAGMLHEITVRHTAFVFNERRPVSRDDYEKLMRSYRKLLQFLRAGDAEAQRLHRPLRSALKLVE